MTDNPLRLRDSQDHTPSYWVVVLMMLWISAWLLPLLASYIFFPAWHALGVGKAVGKWLLHSPAQAIAADTRFFLLYLPDCTLLLAGGLVIGRVFPATMWRLAGFFSVSFAYARFAIGSSPLEYLLASIANEKWTSVATYSVFLLLIYGCVPVGICLSRFPSSPAIGKDACQQCGYLLIGLTINRCPECGSVFALDRGGRTSERRIRIRDRTFLFRIVSMVIAAMVFASLEWALLCATLAKATSWCLLQFGVPCSVYYSGVYLILNTAGNECVIAPECTYIDLYLMLLPFLWKRGAGMYRNLKTALAFLCAVQIGNLFRVVAATYFDYLGYGVTVSHDLPDEIIYMGAFIIIPTYRLLQERVDRFGDMGEARV